MTKSPQPSLDSLSRYIILASVLISSSCLHASLRYSQRFSLSPVLASIYSQNNNLLLDSSIQRLFVLGCYMNSSVIFYEFIFDIQWIHLWYSMNSSLIFYEFIFNIFSIHLWYSMNSSLIFFEFIFDILWIHLWFFFIHLWYFMNSSLIYEFIFDISWIHLWYFFNSSLIFFGIHLRYFMEFISARTAFAFPWYLMLDTWPFSRFVIAFTRRRYIN